MKRFSSILFLLMSVFLAACSQPEEEAAVPCENTLAPLEVDFSWITEEADVVDEAEPVSLQAIVSHDNIPIDDAYEVVFEIWEHANGEYHHIEDAKNQGDGLYALDWTFEDEGVYYVYYHVTACDQHRMEKSQLVVGDVDVDEITSVPDDVELLERMDHGAH
ncbi:FixH family protein [Desertibacillus haloalkaliphilus]|uniref:FixH family protein n=1 Tax=Desertibacillus haloalkaliphilus TaxID=1328930 RepID=UPI001C274D04|nr:FixH family protein [Desertibacillus haloalkaliphilus]MBU8908350.1 FixH family protein [Desertibacillus haloalkaliphilus]